MCPVRRPHMMRHKTPDRMMPQGSKQKTGSSNMYKAPVQSQIRKNYIGTLERNSSTQHKCARSSDLTRCDMARPTEPCLKGENGKWATRTCTRHPGGHNLAKLIWVPLNETTQPDSDVPGRATSQYDATRHARPNDATRGKMENGPPERAQGTRAVTT